MTREGGELLGALLVEGELLLDLLNLVLGPVADADSGHPHKEGEQQDERHGEHCLDEVTAGSHTPTIPRA